MTEEKTYTCSVEDLFRVTASSRREAETILKEKIGSERFEVYNVKTIEEE